MTPLWHQRIQDRPHGQMIGARDRSIGPRDGHRRGLRVDGFELAAPQSTGLSVDLRVFQVAMWGSVVCLAERTSPERKRTTSGERLRSLVTNQSAPAPFAP